VATPDAPTRLAVTSVTSSRISIRWRDNADTESGYQIERKTGSTGTWSQIASVGPNVSTFTDTTLKARTTYYYRVRAFNSGGTSSYSNEVSGTTTR
jgi:hypothetical protein